ncbi:MAG: PIG-L deacetylase family protein [Acidimicrobiales bacterium]
MPELFAEVPARALAVYAHPDDPELSCGATLARWAGRGSQVHVLVCARGEKGSSDPAADPVSLTSRRDGEMERAGEVMGLAGRRQLGIDDGELERSAELRGLIVAAVRELRPEVVVCPDPTAVFFGDTYYNHADHRVTGWATLDAVAPASGNPHYFPDAGPAHRVGAVFLSGTLEPNVWIDIAETLDAKIAAVLCHESQLPDTGEWFAAVLRQRAADDGRTAGVAYAEGFRRLVLAS